MARLNYLAVDRADIGVATNHLARMMAQPRIGDEVALKRVGRYLKGRPICKIKFEMQEPCMMITAHTDSDWAGCRLTRRSTSGSAIFLGKHVLQFACKLQKTVALSSGEAELCAHSAGLAEAFGIHYVLLEFGIQTHIVGKCDSAAARGKANRSGTGRLKHLELKQIWIQKYVRGPLLYTSSGFRIKRIHQTGLERNISSEFHGHIAQLRQDFLQPRILGVKIPGAEGDVGILPSLQYLPIFQLPPHRSVYHGDVRSFGSRQKGECTHSIRS